MTRKLPLWQWTSRKSISRNLTKVNDSLEKLGMGLDAADLEEASESAGSARNAVFYLMVLSAFTKVFGFVREILLANYYGVGEVAEAYKIAQAIPMIILMIVGTGLSTGFIPAYNKADAKSGEKSADRFTSNIMNIVVIFALIFCIIVNLFPSCSLSCSLRGLKGKNWRSRLCSPGWRYLARSSPRRAISSSPT